MRVISISEAARIIKNGGVIAFPTETSFGLGVDPTNEEAIQKIFEIKKRDHGKPITLILSSTQHLSKWVLKPNPMEKKLIKNFWPGPLTLLLKKKKSVSNLLSGGSDRLGVRVSSHPVARKLARQIGGAITATSANISGEPSLRSLAVLQKKLGNRIDGVIRNAKIGYKKDSTILYILNNKLNVIREGSISLRKINEVL